MLIFLALVFVLAVAYGAPDCCIPSQITTNFMALSAGSYCSYGTLYVDFQKKVNRVDMLLGSNGGIFPTWVHMSVFQDLNTQLQWTFIPALKTCTSDPLPSYVAAEMVTCTSQIPGLTYSGPMGFGDGTVNSWSAVTTNGTLSLLLSPSKCYPMLIRMVIFHCLVEEPDSLSCSMPGLTPLPLVTTTGSPT